MVLNEEFFMLTDYEISTLSRLAVLKVQGHVNGRFANGMNSLAGRALEIAREIEANTTEDKTALSFIKGAEARFAVVAR